MKSQLLFPTLVYQQPLFPGRSQKKLNALLSELKHEISVLQKEDISGQRWSKKNYRHGYTSYGSVDRLFEQSTTFSELRKTIDQHRDQYIKELELRVSPRELQMNTLWANVMPKGAYHTMHIHPHSVLSGTFYVETFNNSSPLKFEDPRLGLWMNAPERKAFIEIQPRDGDVILFESWLRHEVPENKSAKSRISLSFNYDWNHHGSK